MALAMAEVAVAVGWTVLSRKAGAGRRRKGEAMKTTRTAVAMAVVQLGSGHQPRMTAVVGAPAPGG